MQTLTKSYQILKLESLNIYLMVINTTEQKRIINIILEVERKIV